MDRAMLGVRGNSVRWVLLTVPWSGRRGLRSPRVDRSSTPECLMPRICFWIPHPFCIWSSCKLNANCVCLQLRCDVSLKRFQAVLMSICPVLSRTSAAPCSPFNLLFALAWSMGSTPQPQMRSTCWHGRPKCH